MSTKDKNNDNLILLFKNNTVKHNEDNETIEMSMNDFISKPFDPDILLKKINNQVNKKIA